MSFEAGIILAVPITAYLMYLINDWFSPESFKGLPISIQKISFWIKHFFQVMIVLMLPTTFTIINILAQECGYGLSFDWLVGGSWTLFFIFLTFYVISLIFYWLTKPFEEVMK